MISNFSDAEYLMKRPPHPRERSSSSQQDSRSSSLLEGYDEPEILRSSSRQFCLTSAEAGQVGEVGAEFTKTESADRRAVGRPRVRQSEVVNAMNDQLHGL
jgi:hypothetical protein